MVLVTVVWSAIVRREESSIRASRPRVWRATPRSRVKIVCPSAGGRPEKVREIRGTRGGSGAGAPWCISMPVKRISSADRAMVLVLSLRCACPPEDTTRQAQGDCVADSDKAAGGSGRGTAAASIGPHARVDPGARRRPWRLHGFPAHNVPRRNPSEGCVQARSNTGAPDGVVSLARCAPRAVLTRMYGIHKPLSGSY